LDSGLVRIDSDDLCVVGGRDGSSRGHVGDGGLKLVHVASVSKWIP
jgi:hypothetical protein